MENIFLSNFEIEFLSAIMCILIGLAISVFFIPIMPKPEIKNKIRFSIIYLAVMGFMIIIASLIYVYLNNNQVKIKAYEGVLNYVNNNQEAIFNCLEDDNVELGEIDFKNSNYTLIRINNCFLPFMNKEDFNEVEEGMNFFEKYKVIVIKDELDKIQTITEINNKIIEK